MDLKGKVALVTGSSSGIGEAIALALAEKGCGLVINYRKNLKGAEVVVSKVKGLGSESLLVKADLSKPGEVKNLFRQIIKKFGQVDILVNNAGESKSGSLDDYEVWKYQFENILLSQVIATSEFLKIKSDGLRKIVNISSIYGSPQGGNLNYIAYSAAKAGVNSFTVNLAKKLGGEVLVNAIAPGWTWTPPWGENRNEEEKSLKGKLAIDRFVEPEEIAKMVVAVLENDAITGQVITVDGGAMLKDLY